MKLRYTLMNDYAFKKLFSREHILRFLLKELGIELDGDVLEYVNTEVKEGIEAKGSRYDIRVRNGKLNFDIEAQNELRYQAEGHRSREIHYLAQLHSASYEGGSSYNVKHKSYVIFINDFSIDDNFITELKLQNRTTGAIYDDMNIIDISLPNLNKCDNLILKSFLEVLKAREYKECDLKEAMEAMDMIKYMNEDDEAIVIMQNIERNQIILNTERSIGKEEGRAEGLEEGRAEGRVEGRAEGRAEGRVEGRAEGLEEGLKEGRIEEKIRMIRLMKESGMSILEISRIIKIEVSEIESLLK